MPSLRVTVLGLAHVHLRDHLAVIAEDPSLSLVAACDPEPERARSLPPQVVVHDPRAAVQAADVVVIDSVTSAHADLVPVAVRAGRPLFVEKPLGRDGAEARRLAALIERAETPFATGFFLRCLPALRRARDLVRQGRLGQLLRVHARFGHAGWSDGAFRGAAAWMLDREQAGFGGFGDLGTHLLDALLWLRPGHDLAVRRADVLAAPGLGTDIGGRAVLAWDDEVPATVGASWTARPGGLRITIEGTADTATVDDGTLTLTGGRSWAAEAPDAGSALRAFVADARGRSAWDAPSPSDWDAPSPSDAVRVARLLDEAYRVATRSTVHE